MWKNWNVIMKMMVIIKKKVRDSNTIQDQLVCRGKILLMLH